MVPPFRLPDQVPSSLSKVEEEGYKCFLEVMSWYRRAPIPTGIETTSFRDTDVIVTTFPKSGTTMIQQMCYQISVACGGGPKEDPTGLNFTDLNHVSPWVEFMPEVGLKPCESKPRTFKSHFDLTFFPQPLKSKHIVVVRSPMSIPSSMMDFLFHSVVKDADSASDKVLEATFDAATHGFLTFISEHSDTNLPAWHSNMKNNLTIANEQKENVLIICYEDAVNDLKATVQKVAKFMDCELSETGLENVVKRCNRDYMAFNDAFGLISEAELFGSRGKSFMKAKVSRKSGFKKFSVKDKYLPVIEEMNKKAFGFSDYNDFRTFINKEMNKIHGF